MPVIYGYVRQLWSRLPASEFMGNSNLMSSKPSRRLIKLVRTTIAQVENSTDLGPNDPAIAELKHNLLRRMADINDPDPPVSTEIPLIEEGPLTHPKNRSDMN